LNALITADFHLTTRPQDAYRWCVFDWLEKQSTRRGVEAIFILGDLTDAKDAHSSQLVNRLVDGLGALAVRQPIYILKGNHDYIDAETPYFRFLNKLENVRYYSSVRERLIDGHQCLFLPHTKQTRKEWEGISLKPYDFIFLHQPFAGAIGDNGFALEEGANPKWFDKEFTNAKVLSGDIHAPQTLRNITYVGAPYPVHFGDHFQPRVLLYKGKPGEGTLTDLNRTTVRKLMIRVGSYQEFAATELFEDDQVSVTVTLPRSEFPDWPSIRDAITEHCKLVKVGLYGLRLEEMKRERLRIDEQGANERPIAKPSEVLRRYGQAYSIEPRLLDVGLNLLKDG
jgi:predicted phosphodiesterase